MSDDYEIDTGLLQEANRVAKEKFGPAVEDLVDRFDLDDDAIEPLATLIGAAIVEGVRLGAMEIAAQLQHHGLTLSLDLRLNRD
jgi:hypothetical protein